ncbi:hypothetical protein LEP1GSC187_3248 [Leptospira santarosai str. ZUN179]|uniref:Uncharacterized protein n=1 Tax=Leptospira santarosai str. ZUN179 TaxID=1049985 RepID=M6ULL3_9LEPT|nr:hypothetical protein LEP1GSC187_3248 [Leptospira santarosai str. ZUN179]
MGTLTFLKQSYQRIEAHFFKVLGRTVNLIKVPSLLSKTLVISIR